MRTTLKRGTARWKLNGRPPQPGLRLGAVSPPSRYGPRRPGPLRLIGRILLWAVVTVLVGAGALGGGIWLYLSESVSAVQARTPEVKEAQEILDVPTPGAPATAIVIGYDKRAGADKDVPARSDTIMLVRADPRAKTISLLSFPRDLVVDLPGCRGQAPWRGRINEAFTYCGPKGTLRAVKQLTGLPINYLISVNFRGFREIVDRIDGVYVDVDRRYFNDNDGRTSGFTYAKINLHAGYQRLAGGSALDYARYRHTDSDLYRIARQQAFVKAFKQQVRKNFGLTLLPGIVNAITHNVEIGVGGGKTLDLGTVYAYAKLAYELPAGNLFQARIEGVSGYAELTAPQQSLDTALRDFVSPDVEAGRKATRAATGKKVGADAPEPSSVTIEVLNGNGVAGAADDAAVDLGQRGYQVTVGGNADRFDYFRTQVVYDPEDPGATAAARVVGDLFGDAELVTAQAELAPETMLRVVVGQTFHGAIAPGPTDRTPKHEPPAVVEDASETLSLLQSAQRRVDFPLLVPTVKERSSSLDREEGIRAYRLGDHDALRIVFRTAGSEYWGVQQTSWTEAPILDGPSVKDHLGRRTYLLYYNGPRLHMVAFEEGGAVYWVSNTLLDRLSNETMLAIARGLQPIPSQP